MNKLILIILLALAQSAGAYQLLNPELKVRWDSGNVRYYINLGPFDDAVNVALHDWSQYTGATHLLGVDVTSGSAWRNGRNDIVWSNTVGENLPWNTLAWCLPNYDWTTGRYIETDIVFNSNFFWSEGNDGGYNILAVALHEIGHSIGLGHAGGVMNPYYTGNTELDADAIAGARFLYGDKTESVPESGSTLALLACGLTALLFRRRK